MLGDAYRVSSSVLQQTIFLRGRLHPEIFQQSVSLLHDRFDALRSTFEAHRGIRLLYEELPPVIHTLDMRGKSGEEQEKTFWEYRSEDFVKGFPSLEERLTRLTLVLLGDDKSAVIWTLHRAVADRFTLRDMQNTLWNFYGRLLEGITCSDLQRETRERRDRWPNDWHEGEESPESRGREGTGETAARAVPSLCCAAAQPVFTEPARLTARLLPDRSERLREMAKSHNIDVKAFFDTAVGILLARYNNKDRAVFGRVSRLDSLFALGEERPIIADILPVTVDYRKDRVVIEQLLDHHRRMEEGTREPGTELDYALLTVYDDNCGDEPVLIRDDLRIVSAELSESTPAPILLQIIEGEELVLDVSYNPNLYGRAEMEIFLNKLRVVVESLLLGWDQKLGGIDVLGEQERRMILGPFNESERDWPKERTLVQLFEEQALRNPAKSAMVSETAQMSYGRLNARANQLAKKLRDAGIQQDDLVAVVAARGFERIVGILGTLKSGGAYLPLDPALQPGALDAIFESAVPKVVLFEDNPPPMPDAVGRKAVLIDLADESIYTEYGENLPPVGNARSLACCMYAADSAGILRGVLMEHRNIIGACIGFIRDEIVAEDRILQFSSCMSSGSVWEIFTALLSGATLCLAGKSAVEDEKLFGAYVDEKGVTVALLPPTLYSPEILQKFRLLVTAGGPAPGHILEVLTERQTYIHTYGALETTGVITAWKWDGQARLANRPIPIGHPLPNCKAYILDGNVLCGIGIPGELCFSGVSVARECGPAQVGMYSRFAGNPYGEGEIYRTGDMARWLPDGNIEYLGMLAGLSCEQTIQEKREEAVQVPPAIPTEKAAVEELQLEDLITTMPEEDTPLEETEKSPVPRLRRLIFVTSGAELPPAEDIFQRKRLLMRQAGNG